MGCGSSSENADRREPQEKRSKHTESNGDTQNEKDTHSKHNHVSQPTERPPEESKQKFRPRQKTPPPTLQSGTGSDNGILECQHDFRQCPEEEEMSYPPEEFPYVDYDFGPDVAIEGETVDWKRPSEIREAPVLFSKGTTRYDIGQGGAGTCWFLSIVAMLAEKPNLFHRVVSEDAWNSEGGYFYCNFWKFGKWETVYIDDFLPVIPNTDQLWGAHSAGDRNEMWPAFLEKAFAKFHGNYNASYGGHTGDAFLALTGGCSEYIDFDEALKKDEEGSRKEKAMALHRRLKTAVQQGESILTTDVPSRFDKKHGLVGGHAYSLTSARTVNTLEGEQVHLVRVRNPWGRTEWTGAWSDGSGEWETIEPGSVPHAKIDDGEFWISLKDFIHFFSGVTVCSVVPDVDRDGCTDSLHYCTSILGDWVGETAAGFRDRINNPRYMFELTSEGDITFHDIWIRFVRHIWCARGWSGKEGHKESITCCVFSCPTTLFCRINREGETVQRGIDENGKVPVVVQICQKLKNRKSNIFSIRVDLYKVLGERSGGQVNIVMELLGEATNVYKHERQMSIRHKVEPGTYAVVPSAMDEGQEKEFIVRIYTSSPLSVREISRDYSIMETSQFECPDEAVSISHIKTSFGSWTEGYNGGGQVACPTFYKNPEIEFEIYEEDTLVNVILMQEKGEEWYPIGLRLFQLDEGCDLCDDETHQEYLYEHYESCPRTVEGEQGSFVAGKYADITHKLGPGRYFVILHTDKPSQEKRFSVIIRSSSALEPRFHRLE